MKKIEIKFYLFSLINVITFLFFISNLFPEFLVKLYGEGYFLINEQESIYGFSGRITSWFFMAAVLLSGSLLYKIINKLDNRYFIWMISILFVIYFTQIVKLSFDFILISGMLLYYSSNYLLDEKYLIPYILHFMVSIIPVVLTVILYKNSKINIIYFLKKSNIHIDAFILFGIVSLVFYYINGVSVFYLKGIFYSDTIIISRAA